MKNPLQIIMTILGKLFSRQNNEEVAQKLEIAPVKKEIAPEKEETDLLNHPKKKKIQQILNVFETGSPEGNYSNVSIFKDASQGKYKQITYGRSQTTQQSHLKELVDNYINANGEYSKELSPYKGRGSDLSLVNDDYFISLLKKAGNDPIMRKVQDELFDKRYWVPAMKWAKDNGFVLPISHLVIFDSFIHSGGILSFLRKRFPEVPPSKGGVEIEYIRSYLKTRHQWLKYHSRPELRKTIYRTSAMINHLEKGDLKLDRNFLANGVWVQ